LKIIDLSHKLDNKMSFYTEDERAKIYDYATYDKDYFNEKKLEIFTHTGTHMDAPRHMIDNAKTIDEYEPSYFIGKALLIDITNYKLASLDFIKSFKEKLKEVDFVILRTNWDKYWGEESYLSNYPTLEIEAAKYICSFNNIRGIGIDSISIDRFDTKNYDIHKEILSKEKIIIENLKNLKFIDKETFTINALPLNIENGDGSLTRAIAIIE